LRQVFTSFAVKAGAFEEANLEEYLAPLRESGRARAGHEGWADDLVVDTVDGAAHWLPEEQPALLAEKVLHRFAGAGR
jgi:hypothetical protein